MIGLLFLILFLLFLLVVLFVIIFIYRKLKAPKAIRIMAALFIPLAPIVWFVSDEFIAERQLQEMCQKANFGKAVFEPDKISNITVRQEENLQLIKDTALAVEYGKLSNFNAQTGEFLYKYEYFMIVEESRFARLLNAIYGEGMPTITFFISKQPCETLDTPDLRQFNSQYE